MYVVVDTYIHEIVRYIDVHVRDTFTLTGHGMSEVEKRDPHPPYLVGRHVMYLGRFDSEVFFCFFDFGNMWICTVGGRYCRSVTGYGWVSGLGVSESVSEWVGKTIGKVSLDHSLTPSVCVCMCLRRWLSRNIIYKLLLLLCLHSSITLRGHVDKKKTAHDPEICRYQLLACRVPLLGSRLHAPRTPVAALKPFFPTSTRESGVSSRND